MIHINNVVEGIILSIKSIFSFQCPSRLVIVAGLFFRAFLHSLGFLNKLSPFYKNISTRYVTEVFQLLYQTLCLLFYRLRSTPKVTNNQKKLILFSLIRCRCCDSGFVYNLITKTVFVLFTVLCF